MITPCPYCKKNLKIDERMAGQQGECPACHRSFKISTRTTEATNAPAAAKPDDSHSTDPASSYGTPPPLPVRQPTRTAGMGPLASPPGGRGVAAVGGGPTHTPMMRTPPLADTQPRADLDPLPGPRADAAPRDPGAPISIWHYRHQKEKFRFLLATVVSGLAWLAVTPVLLLTALWLIPIVLGVLLIGWAMTQFYRASVMGSSVRVSSEQHPEIYTAARDIASALGMQRLPEIFVVSSNGQINALALRLLGGRFIFLSSDLIDLMLSTGRRDELDVVLAHELAHHAAGHVAIIKNLFLKPAMLLPFFGSAYGRAKELTADRLALAVTGKLDAAQRALAALASGSRMLVGKLNLQALVAQEEDIPEILGFLNQMYAYHPRLTQRIVELERFMARQTAPAHDFVPQSASLPARR